MKKKHTRTASGLNLAEWGSGRIPVLVGLMLLLGLVAFLNATGTIPTAKAEVTTVVKDTTLVNTADFQATVEALRTAGIHVVTVNAENMLETVSLQSEDVAQIIIESFPATNLDEVTLTTALERNDLGLVARDGNTGINGNLLTSQQLTNAIQTGGIHLALNEEVLNSDETLAKALLDGNPNRASFPEAIEQTEGANVAHGLTNQ